MPFLGFVQKYYCPELLRLGSLVQGLFRGCAEILIFGEIFTSEIFRSKCTIASCPGVLEFPSFRVPLGVCAGIAPFNFPAMIPLWMFPTGLVTGNTYVMKVGALCKPV